jgi:beta-barrel assembly-enhancing protease
MRRIAVLAAVMAIAGAALYYGERGRADVPVTPAPLLHMIGDAEREATRVPMKMTRLSDDQEIEAGNQLAAQYELSMQKSNDADRRMAGYVAMVGARLAANSHRRLPYRFHYVPKMGFVNAFALPGGHIFIGKGLIALMDSEDELAGVLGHELEHVDHYHCAERLQTEAIARKIPLGSLAMLPVELFQAGYSKEQELEADREGILLASSSGYSALAAARLFATMEARYGERQAQSQTPQGEVSRVVLASLTEYFRSHPETAERIAQIKQVAAREHLPIRQERPLQVGVEWQQVKR